MEKKDILFILTGLLIIFIVFLSLYSYSRVTTHAISVENIGTIYTPTETAALTITLSGLLGIILLAFVIVYSLNEGI